MVLNGDGTTAINTPSVMSLNTWHHFVITVTRTGTNVSLYVDGSLQATNTSVTVDADIEKIALGHGQSSFLLTFLKIDR